MKNTALSLNNPQIPCQKDEHCNVLLLALSTFWNPMEENSFLWDNGREEKKYEGIYQLDPVPRMLADQLGEKQEYLDKLILLCTESTRKKKTVKIKYLDGKKADYEGTPLDYFLEHVEPYMNPNKEDERFIIVEIDENKLEEGICETVKIVRSIKNPRLYMDTHGGFREVSLVAEAVISLLKVEKIETQGIYGVKFTSDNTSSTQNRIVDGSRGFHIFDFVSGMNEFINYGRINSLEDFLNKNKGSDEEENRKQDELVRCIRTISEGIQLCNIPLFENGLEKLTEYFNKVEHQEEVHQSSTYLSIFMDNIKNDYGVLLSPERTVMDEINWCRKKGFYQQVLTLIESRIPEYLKILGIYDCDTKEKKNKNNPTAVFNQCIPWRYREKTEKKNRIKKGHRKYYPYKKISYKVYEEDTSTNTWVEFHVPEEEMECLDKFLDLHIELKNLRNESNHASKENKTESLKTVEDTITKYLECLKELKPEKHQAKIKNITGKGNVMLDILSGMEGMEQCVLKNETEDENWHVRWKAQYVENPDKIYEVEYIGRESCQFLFRLK